MGARTSKKKSAASGKKKKGVPRTRVGKPTLLSSGNVMEALAHYICQGLPVNRACTFCGTAKSNYYHWMQWGREGKEGYVEFYNTICDALPKREIKLLKDIEKNNDWRAKAKRLAIIDPEVYGERRITSLEGNSDKPIQINSRNIDITKIPAHIRKQLVEQMIYAHDSDQNEEPANGG